jgi:hypothetical protein
MGGVLEAYENKGIAIAPLTIPPMVMPDEFKTAGTTLLEVVQAYRNYYCFDKIKMARYDHCVIPRFLVECAQGPDHERIPYMGLGKALVDNATDFRDQAEYLQRKIQAKLAEYEGSAVTPELKERLKNRFKEMLPLSRDVDNIKFQFDANGETLSIEVPLPNTHHTLKTE